jgi:predicted ATP-grasp superfamily ATP-dependent carboligase
MRRAVSTSPLRLPIDRGQRYPIEVREARSRHFASTRRVDAIVCDAAERQALVCVRSLGRAGTAVGLVENRADAPSFHSRWCSSRALVPDRADRPAEFVDAVLAAARAQRARIVFPLHDGSIHALRVHRDEVERQVALPLASEAALDIAVTKARTLALAVELGIEIPRSRLVEHVGEVRAAADELGFPLVVKPSTSWVQERRNGSRLICTLAANLPEACAAVDTLLEVGGAPILQEWLVGSREAVSIFRAEGRVWARFAQVAHRMNPPLGGSSVVRESIPLPADLTDASERLVEAADLDGYSEIEFRRDAQGRPRLMEINPRLSASVEIAVRSGVDFPLLLYRWAAGGRLQPVSSFRTGLRMRWLGGDVRWLRSTLGSQGRPEAVPALHAIGAFCAEFLRPAAYDYVDRGDPGPALSAAACWAGRVAAAARRRSSNGQREVL